MDKRTKEIVEDIRSMFGPVGVLYAEQLGQYIGRTTKAIYELWDSLPIPIVPVGGRPAVAVLDVAAWLASGKPKAAPAKPGAAPPVPAPKRKKEQLEILLRGLVQQRNFLADFYAEIERQIIESESQEADQTNEDLGRGGHP